MRNKEKILKVAGEQRKVALTAVAIRLTGGFHQPKGKARGAKFLAQKTTENKGE